jgi:hypothetical protein
MTDLELLSNRVEKLEKRVRRWKRAAMFVGFVVTSGAVMAQVRGIQGPGEVLPKGGLPRIEGEQPRPVSVEAEVRSRNFVLVDEKGKERASLVADGAGSVFLVMFDAAGKTRTHLSVGNDGPALTFYDPSGQARTILGSTTLVGSHVHENGITEKAPASSIVMFDRTGKLLFRTP